MRSCVCRRGNKDGLRNTERLLAGRGIGDNDCSDLLVATIKMRLAVWKEVPRNLRNVICSGRFRHTRSENYCNCDDQQLPYSHRANPPNIFWSTIFVLTRFLHASRYPSRENASQRNTSGGTPSRICPTCSKWAPRAWICWESVCMSRKRRSKGLPGQIASTPAAL